MDTAIYPIINEESGLPCIVYGIGTQIQQCHIIRNEGYNLHQIIFSIKGKGILKTNGQQYNVTEGSYFYLKPNEPHEYYKLSEHWETHWILFSGENITNILNKFSITKSKVYYSVNANLKNTFSDIISILKIDDKYKGLMASNLLYKLLIDIYRTTNQEVVLNKTQDTTIINPIINYININYSDEISLETLSKLVNITPQHLCKVFKKRLYMRPFEYINKRRIQESKKLLIGTNTTIKDIGKIVGYKDTSYFCAMFKKHELMSPSQFRGNL